MVLGSSPGFLVLKDLGFKVDKYVASEICQDSLAVTRFNHETKVTHVEDVRLITEDQVGALSVLYRPRSGPQGRSSGPVLRAGPQGWSSGLVLRAGPQGRSPGPVLGTGWWCRVQPLPWGLGFSPYRGG